MKMNWELRQTDQNTVAMLTQEFGLSPLIARILNNRFIFSQEEAERFLNPSFKDLPPPSLLKDIDKATERIVSAIENKERILIFGDYDVDGITATSLLYRFLCNANALVSFYIPNRITEGYGLKPSHIRSCALNKNINLIITVDCGSSSHAAILEAQHHNIDVIVTDHHEPPENLPEALAMINPKRKDASIGLNDLAGVGVAFYLIINLRMQLRANGFWRGQQEPNLKMLCDLVALGTVADVVPMVNENRILTRAGLEVLQTKGNTGIRMLMDQCRIDKRHMDSMDIAYKLAPRLNAAGRVAHADAAMALLEAENTGDAAQHAEHLHVLNQKRRDMEKVILEEIDDYLVQHPFKAHSKIALLHSRGWHVGILGIVASRLVNQYALPFVVLTLDGEIAKGSARSIPGIDLALLFSKCSRHLISHGGHAMAAGLQLHVDNIEAFRDALEKNVEDMGASGMTPLSLKVDATLGFKEITRALMDELELLKPFGEKNPEPLFVSENVHVRSSKILSGGHRRMALNQADGHRFQAIHFSPARDAAALNFFKKIAFRLQFNRWNGQENIQLVIEDIMA
jgi:single-stranded-DNA-specific exonuclease